MFGSHFIVTFVSHFSYPGIVLYLAGLGYFIPIPEEIVLTLIGYLAGIGKINPWYSFLAIMSGVLIGENIIYWLSIAGSRYIDKLKAKVKSDVVARYEDLMRQNIGKTLFVLRFFIGFRFLGALLAGSIKVSWRRFMIYDTVILGIYSAFFFLAGFLSHRHISSVIDFIDRFRSFLLVIICLTIFIVIARKYLKRKNS